MGEIEDTARGPREDAVAEGFIRVHCMRMECNNYLDIKQSLLHDKPFFDRWECGQCGWINRLV